MSSAAEPHIDTRRSAADRVLDVLEVLCAHPISGVTNSDIAHATGSTPSQVTRDMAVVIRKGWARKREESGRFHPAPAFTALSFRVLDELNSAQQRMDDQRHAFTGGRA